MKKKRSKKCVMSIAIPEEDREWLEAKVTAGETPTAAWWIRRLVRLAREAEKGA